MLRGVAAGVRGLIGLNWPLCCARPRGATRGRRAETPTRCPARACRARLRAPIVSSTHRIRRADHADAVRRLAGPRSV